MARFQPGPIIGAMVIGGVVGALFRLAYLAAWSPPGSYAIMPASALVLLAGGAVLVIAFFVGLWRLLGHRSPVALIATATAVVAWQIVAAVDSPA